MITELLLFSSSRLPSQKWPTWSGKQIWTDAHFLGQLCDVSSHTASVTLHSSKSWRALRAKGPWVWENPSALADCSSDIYHSSIRKITPQGSGIYVLFPSILFSCHLGLRGQPRCLHQKTFSRTRHWSNQQLLIDPASSLRRLIKTYTKMDKYFQSPGLPRADVNIHRQKTHVVITPNFKSASYFFANTHLHWRGK